MSHEQSEPSGGSEPDPFDAIGREIASLLRATHDSSNRIQAEAEQRATDRLAEADREATARVAEAEARVAEAEARVADANRQAAEQLAEAERHESESTRQREEAAAVLRQAEATRDQTRAEATALLRGILELLDAADARSSQLVEDIQGSRSALATVRSGLAEFGDTIGAAGDPTSGLSQAHAAPDAAGGGSHAEPGPEVIDLREQDATQSAAPDDAAGGGSSAPTGPTARSTQADKGVVADTLAMDDRVAASVRSAVSRAIDQCLTQADGPPPPPAPR